MNTGMEQKIVWIDETLREEAIKLVNQFFRQVNAMTLDGLFKIRPRAATRMVDLYLKLVGAGNVVFVGILEQDKLLSLVIARVEEKPLLEEEKTLFIDLAVTKKGHMGKGHMNALVDFTERWAVEKNIPAIELRAIAENSSAVAYWEKRGYDPFYVRFRKKLV